MDFNLSIRTHNAALTGESGGDELARILRAVADDVEAGFGGRPIKDANGGTVGRWEWERDDDDDDDDGAGWSTEERDGSFSEIDVPKGWIPSDE